MVDWKKYDTTKEEVQELLSQFKRPSDVAAALAGYDDMVKQYGHMSITTYLKHAVKSFNHGVR